MLVHTSNNNLIPLNASIEAELLALRDGEGVRLMGDLVDAHSSDDWFINTSLVRDDDGEGACEVILVRGVQVKN